MPAPRTRSACLMLTSLMLGFTLVSVAAQPPRKVRGHGLPQSSFRPGAGERNPFLPLGHGSVQGSSTPAGMRGTWGAGLPERFRTASQAEPPVTNPTPISIDERIFHLSGILLDDNPANSLAVINGDSRAVGDKLMADVAAGLQLEFTVAEIYDREVVLKCQEVEVRLELKGKSEE